MSRRTTGSHRKAVQAGIETLDYRMIVIAGDFKNFLEEHQKVVKKQEAKKERIIGNVGSTSGAASGGGYRNNQVSQSQNSLHNKRKMKILPQHAAQ